MRVFFLALGIGSSVIGSLCAAEEAAMAVSYLQRWLRDGGITEKVLACMHPLVTQGKGGLVCEALFAHAAYVEELVRWRYTAWDTTSFATHRELLASQNQALLLYGNKTYYAIFLSKKKKTFTVLKEEYAVENVPYPVVVEVSIDALNEELEKAGWIQLFVSLRPRVGAQEKPAVRLVSVSPSEEEDHEPIPPSLAQLIASVASPSEMEEVFVV